MCEADLTLLLRVKFRKKINGKILQAIKSSSDANGLDGIASLVRLRCRFGAKASKNRDAWNASFDEWLDGCLHRWPCGPHQMLTLTCVTIIRDRIRDKLWLDRFFGFAPRIPRRPYDPFFGSLVREAINEFVYPEALGLPRRRAERVMKVVQVLKKWEPSMQKIPQTEKFRMLVLDALQPS